MRPHRLSLTGSETVCILGVNKNVPVAQFAAKLKASLDEMGEASSYLDQATVMRHLGRHAFSRMGWVPDRRAMLTRQGPQDCWMAF